MKSLKHVTEKDKERFWANAIVKDGCWGWTGYRNTKNYAAMLSQDLGRSIGAHRISWVIHNGPTPDGMCVCHHCDNPECTNPDHLFLGTYKDNIRDMMNKGRQSFRPPGSANPQAKLTEEQVLEIRSLHDQGVGYRNLSKRFSMGETVIWRIVKRKKWTHI